VSKRGESESSARAQPAVARGDSAGLPQVELDLLIAKWGDVVSAVRAKRRGVLAAALEHASLRAVSGQGEISLELPAENDGLREAIERGASDVLVAIGGIASGASRIHVTVAPTSPASMEAAPRRLTEQAIKAERLAALRKRDPALDAAVDALDLELLD